jgi:hypothetical protein
VNTAALLATEAAESSVNMPYEPIVYGIVALVIFVALLIIVTRFDPDR